MLTKKELEIFGAFGLNVEKELTFQELKKHAKQRSNNAVSRAIKRFRTEELITERKIGSTKLYQLVTTNERCFNYLALYFEELIPKSARKPVQQLLTTLDQKIPFYAVTIFGSYAKGTQTKQSDLDVAIIVPDKTSEVTAKVIARSIANKSLIELDVQVVLFSEFSDMLRADYENLGKQIKEKHLPIRNPGSLYRAMHGQHNQG